MPFPIVPVGIGLLTATAVAVSARRKNKKNFGVMTAERERIYKAALSGSLKDPQALHTLSEAFRKEGLNAQADLLSQRAALKERPPELKAKHDDAFRKALKSTNKVAVLQTAKAFASIGATGAAMRLAQYANGLGDTPATPGVTA